MSSQTKFGLRFAGILFIATALILSLRLANYATATTRTSYLLPSISETELQNNLKTLAGDDFEGRRTGTEGATKAASFLAERFEEIGLTAPFADGFLQRFVITIGTKIGEKNLLRWEGPGNIGEARLQKDYIPLDFSGAGEAEGDLVFAGYGITAKEFNYDDFTGFDVKDKILLLFRYEPQENDKKSVFLGKTLTQYSDLRYKVSHARQLGAKAVLLVTPSVAHPDQADELAKFKGGFAYGDVGLPVLHITNSFAKRLLEGTGIDLEQIQKDIDKDLKPRTTYLPHPKVRLNADLIHEAGPAFNVVGYLPGNDPSVRDEVIVVGAHYDHLGRGGASSLVPESKEIHYGADDNASGTTALLAVAEGLAQNREVLRRTVAFIAFGGEEEGLLGSSYYVKNPVLPIEKTVAMINMDMVGRGDKQKLILLGIDTAKEFRELTTEVNKDVGFTLSFDPGGYGMSDQTSFLVKNIPVIFLFTGVHKDYHKPSDTWDKIDFEKLSRVAKFCFLVVTRLDSFDAKPTFVAVSSPPPSRDTGGGYGAYLGTIPEFGESEIKGVKIAGVRADSPAEKAGLKGGDIITKVNDKEIKDLYDLTYFLRDHKPGEEVEITFIRDGQEMTTKATLGKR